MKHRIRWTVLLGLDVIFIIFALIIIELYYPDFGQRFGKRSFVGQELGYFFIIAMLINHIFLGSPKAELSDSMIKLTGFNIRAAGNISLSDRTVSIQYKDVYKITAIRLPLFGVVRIKVSANHFRKNFSFSCLYTKHKKLFRKLCTNVKQANPDAVIDERLTIYTEG